MVFICVGPSQSVPVAKQSEPRVIAFGVATFSSAKNVTFSVENNALDPMLYRHIVDCLDVSMDSEGTAAFIFSTQLLCCVYKEDNAKEKKNGQGNRAKHDKRPPVRQATFTVCDCYPERRHKKWEVEECEDNCAEP